MLWIENFITENILGIKCRPLLTLTHVSKQMISIYFHKTDSYSIMSSEQTNKLIFKTHSLVHYKYREIKNW